MRHTATIATSPSAGRAGSSPKAEFDHAKVNTRNLTHADDDFPDYEHCVAEIWDSSREVNLEDFLTAESLIFKDCLDWYVDGTKQSSSILNYGSAPGNNEIKDYEVHVTVKDSFTICDRLILVIVPTSTEQAHNDWVTTWSTNTAWLAELPAAYSALASGNANPEPGTCATLYWDEWGVRGLNNYYHPGSAFDMRSNETPGGMDIRRAIPRQEPLSLQVLRLGLRIAPIIPTRSRFQPVTASWMFCPLFVQHNWMAIQYLQMILFLLILTVL